MRKLKVNSIQCLGCNKILISTNRHDYQTCGCSNQTFIDGGLFYNRCGGMNTDLIKDLCEFEEEEDEQITRFRKFEAI